MGWGSRLDLVAAFALLACITPGCAARMPELRAKAARQMTCPEENLQIEEAGKVKSSVAPASPLYRVTGCGRRSVYMEVCARGECRFVPVSAGESGAPPIQ